MVTPPGPSDPRLRAPLFRRRGLTLLIAAGLISQTGDWVLLVGLPFFVYRLTGSALATSGVFLAGLVPPIVVGTVAGVFVDRWSRKRTMIATNLVLAAGLVPLLFVHSAAQLWLLYVVIVFESCVDPFFGPAEGALIPQLVPPEELVGANGAYAGARQVSRLLGAATGGLVVGLLGLLGVVAVDSLSFVASAALLAFISEGGRTILRDATVKVATLVARLRAVVVEWKAGLAVAWESPRAREVLAFAMLLGLGEGVFAALAAPFLVGILSADGAEYGLFFSLQAVGGVAGGVVAGTALRARRPERVLPWAFVAFAVLDGLLFNYPLVSPRILPAFLIIGFVGVPSTIGIAAFSSLQQTAVPDEYRGRFLGSANAALGFTMVIGAVLAGTLASVVGVIPLLELQVVGPLLGALWVWRAERNGSAGARSRTTTERAAA
ncbi:MAG: MFS transporter [Thermoplasmata archaeon]|nr:MFS transporter [Thermoplasmata archaeon]